jgi:peptidoglycan/xylan/chitin deacetylase (PgdA/CDA1 family)
LALGLIAFLSCSCERTNFDDRLHLSFDVEAAQPDVLLGVLDALDQKHVPASFFFRGEALARLPDHGRSLLTAIRQRGHLIGNHSFSHPNFTHMSAEAIQHELDATDALLRDFVTVRLMRPPFAADDARVRGVIRDLGYVQLKWDVQAGEYAGWDANYLADKPNVRERFLQHVVAKANAKHGGILNVHDGPVTTENLDAILARLEAAGFRFVPLEYFLATRSAL